MLRRLHELLGSLTYLGKCPSCHRQHMSANALVDEKRRCETCAKKI